LCACMLGIAAATRVRGHAEPELVEDVVPAS
jgi:hypothetical protein